MRAFSSPSMRHPGGEGEGRRRGKLINQLNENISADTKTSSSHIKGAKVGVSRWEL